MNEARSKAKSFGHRAILVIGALLCLCVSDSAGPRLVPLPALSLVFPVSAFSLETGPSALQTPTPSREPSAYLQMVAGSQYRPRDYHHHSQLSTHTPQAFCQLQPSNLATTPETYAPLSFKTAPLSKPTGRAPPRFA